jgi:hypothetical protein
MSYRSTSAIYAVIKEATFNGGGTFTDADVVEVTSDTALKPEIDAIERKAVSNSFLSSPKLPGKESGSGTFAVELIPVGGGSNDINGSAILEVALGTREDAGPDTGALIGVSDASGTPANMIYEVQAGETGTAVLYKLNKPCGGQDSLAIKQFYGCDTTDSEIITYTGIVPNSVTFDFPVADIATVSFDTGASGFNTTSNETILNALFISTNPYVGKNAIFTVDDVSYEAKDLQFTIENTVSDREALTSSGITDKIITTKMIKGTLTVTFENYDELNKFKNSTDAAIFLLMTSSSGTDNYQFAIYLPRARYTSVSIEDDDGILANKIEFEAYEDASGEAILIAHELK